MKHLFTPLIALASGLLFGLGLLLSGMTNPAKVKGFLDLFGPWDPSLALVMGGAIALAVFAFARAKRLTFSGSGEPMNLPTATTIDARLIGGGLLFGLGWGIAGFCPGPALVAMAAGLSEAWWFGGAMLVGMWAVDAWAARSSSTAAD